jgi:hypothetical protein
LGPKDILTPGALPIPVGMVGLLLVELSIVLKLLAKRKRFFVLLNLCHVITKILFNVIAGSVTESVISRVAVID